MSANDALGILIILNVLNCYFWANHWARGNMALLPLQRWVVNFFTGAFAPIWLLLGIYLITK